MASTASTAEQGDFVQVVRQHPHRDALAELCCDVLSRHARTSAARPARKQVKARARAHAVRHGDASTSFGNVLELLQRAPAREAGSALVGAFAMAGLGHWLQRGHVPEEELEDFVRWLAATPGYAAFEVAPALLSEGALTRLAELLQEACIHAEDRSRAESVGLLEALSRVDPEGDYLAALAGVLDDPVLEACADALGGEPRRVSSPAPVPRYRAHVEGLWVAASGTGPLRVLGWLTGWALVRRLGRFLAWLLRWQSHARVAIDGRVVRVERWRSVLGRQVHVIDESLRAEDVRAVVRVLRRPVVVALVGAACLFAGVLGFGVGVNAALRDGGFVPVAWGLFALGCGAGSDLLLDYVARSREGKVWLEILASDRPPLRLAGVDPEAAGHLTRALDALRTP